MRKSNRLFRGVFRFFFLVFFLFNFIAFTAPGTDYVISETKSEKIIPIAMATDNNYFYPTIISMISMCENKKSDTFLEFNVMVSGNVTEENRKKIKNIQEMYRMCTVKIFDMKAKFSGAHVAGYLTTSAYYRLCIASLLPKYNKVLYIDSDTIVKSDLWKLYTVDIENYYIAAARGIGICQQMQDKKNRESYSKRLRIKDMDQYINSGVLLINAKKIREDNLEKRFYEYIPYLKKIGSNFLDQDVINAVCYGKIKCLSPIYNYSTSLHNYKGVMPKEFTQDFELNDIKNPVIVHYAGEVKPWKTDRVPHFYEWKKYSTIYENKIKNLR